MAKLTYNGNNREHVGFADVLGKVQGTIINGTLTRNTSHAYYAGHELRRVYAIPPTFTGIFLKADCYGSGKTKNGRSQNRIIVPVQQNGDLLENIAFVWRHDSRILMLSEGFFKRASQMRKYYSK